jgi:nitroimidazol reductase NimA-like FMN-containing flavoprotein (pyridoxamine 5'-phosphate oxidase superfamily)
MDDDEMADFLGTGGTGVISLPAGTNDPPHSVPVSYGFDDTDGHFFFRLAVGEDSAKGDLADGGPVTFVTYRETGEGWQSVVAAGDLEPVDEVDVSSGVLESLRRSEIPMIDVFDRHPREVTFRFLRLAPDELTGRTETTADS